MAKPVFVFATQRSGTNFLRYCLATDKRIKDLNEIFGFNVRPALFWRHRKKVLDEQPEMIFPSDDNMSKLFESFILEFVEPLDVEYALIDVKYNSVHNLNPVWQSLLEVPFLLKEIKKHQFPVIHLVRRNVLETHISNVRAKRTGQYVANVGDDVESVNVRLDLSNLINELSRRLSEIQVFENWLCGLGLNNLYSLDYEEILGLNTGVVPDCIDGMLNDLGVSVDCLTPRTVKLVSSLNDMVENFDSEVKPLLQGADLGYLLKAA